MAVTKIKPIKSTLSKALDYIQNPAKTEEKLLVSSFGCSYETADIEFAYTLSQALEKGNNLAHHLMQSFEPGEVSYEKAHEIGRQLADAVTKGQHVSRIFLSCVPVISWGFPQPEHLSHRISALQSTSGRYFRLNGIKSHHAGLSGSRARCKLSTSNSNGEGLCSQWLCPLSYAKSC